MSKNIVNNVDNCNDSVAFWGNIIGMDNISYEYSCDEQ